MITVHEEYLVDEAGTRKAVVLPLAAWQQIKEELEELDDIRAYSSRNDALRYSAPPQMAAPRTELMVPGTPPV